MTGRWALAPKAGEGEREVADRVCPRVDGDEASHGKLVANPIQTKLTDISVRICSPASKDTLSPLGARQRLPRLWGRWW